MLNKKYLTTKQASEFISESFFPVSPKTLSKLRCVGGSPKYSKAGERRVLYFVDDLISWAKDKISKPIENSIQEVLYA